MQFEPGIVDANVLVYALDSMAPQHLSSRALLDQAHNGLTTLYVTSQVLCEFTRLSQMPGAFSGRALPPKP